LLDGTDIDTDQLKEIIDAYSLADTNILSQIASLQERLTTIENRYNTTFPSST
jgi:flagellar capping protein FliD